MQQDSSVARLTLPPTRDVDVDLVPRHELGGAPTGGRLAGRLSVGAPIFTTVATDEIAVGVLEEYLRKEASSSDFHLLHLVVNLRPDEDEPFTHMGVGVALAYVPDRGERPIAWALSPSRSAGATAVSTTLGLTAKLGIVEPHAARTVEGQREDAFVVAFGERESDFEWRYTATSRQALRGIQPMFAVIKADKGATIRADIVLSASVRRSVFGLARYRADLPPLLATATTGA